MSRFRLLLLTLMLPVMQHAQPLAAFQLYDGKTGQPVTFEAMTDQLQSADVVFFGELHNNPIAHWLQYELTRQLFDRRQGQLTLGAEMFEADNQVLLDEYLADRIRQKDFEGEARLWNNYATDYKPLLEFAKSKSLAFIATNIPRRYANLVFRQDLPVLDSLSDEAKAWIAPLPIEVDLELPGYKNMLTMMGGHGGSDNPTIVKAQAAKDATMAHFIAANLRPGFLFLHYNGAYHSDNKEGILWYLQRYRPNLRLRTITTVEQATTTPLAEEHLGKADFILCVPESMTKTY